MTWQVSNERGVGVRLATCQIPADATLHAAPASACCVRVRGNKTHHCVDRERDRNPLREIASPRDWRLHMKLSRILSGACMLAALAFASLAMTACTSPGDSGSSSSSSNGSSGGSSGGY